MEWPRGALGTEVGTAVQPANMLGSSECMTLSIGLSVFLPQLKKREESIISDWRKQERFQYI